MRHLFLIVLIGSILSGQPNHHYSTFQKDSPLSGAEIRELINDRLANNSLNLHDDPTTGRPTLSIDQKWFDNKWINVSKTEYIYALAKTSLSDFPKLSEVRYYYAAGSSWVNNAVDMYKRDQDDNLIELQMNYGGLPSTRRTYSEPFVGGNPTVSTNQYYEDGVYVNDERTTYTFNANNCISEEILDKWNKTTLVWEPSSRIQYNYDQGCCPVSWVFSNWANNTWLIYYMAAFSYANCMTDVVPFFTIYSNLSYSYICNPILVLMGPTTNGTDMISVASTDEITYNNNCLATAHSIVGANIQQLTNYFFTPLPGTGKISSLDDNSNQRFTKQITQTIPFGGSELTNSTKTFHSYEGLLLDTQSEISIPKEFSLNQNYPNPFNPSTKITFELLEDSDVVIDIYDIAGRLIRQLIDEPMKIGTNSITWDGKDDEGNPASGGVYIYNLKAGDANQTRKMVLLR